MEKEEVHVAMIRESRVCLLHVFEYGTVLCYMYGSRRRGRRERPQGERPKARSSIIQHDAASKVTSVTKQHLFPHRTREAQSVRITTDEPFACDMLAPVCDVGTTSQSPPYADCKCGQAWNSASSRCPLLQPVLLCSC